MNVRSRHDNKLKQDSKEKLLMTKTSNRPKSHLSGHAEIPDGRYPRHSNPRAHHDLSHTVQPQTCEPLIRNHISVRRLKVHGKEL